MALRLETLWSNARDAMVALVLCREPCGEESFWLFVLKDQRDTEVKDQERKQEQKV